MIFKNNRKKIPVTLLTIFFVTGFLFFLSSSLASGQLLKFQIPVDKLASISPQEMKEGSGIAIYLAAIYTWFVTAIAILAVLFMMIGGIILLTAAGNSQKVSLGKKFIIDSLWGLCLVLGSYIFLSTINPDLVNLKNIALDDIDRIDFKTWQSFDQWEQEAQKLGLEHIPGQKCTGALNWTQGLFSGLDASDIDAILRRSGSPLAGLGTTILQAAQSHGIDPAFALAIWRHDSSFGKAGAGAKNFNPGNLICKAGRGGSCNGRWHHYNSWADAVIDWFAYADRVYKSKPANQIILGEKINVHIINGFVKKYAPKSENDVGKYIDSISSAFIMWSIPANKVNVKQKLGCS